MRNGLPRARLRRRAYTLPIALAIVSCRQPSPVVPPASPAYDRSLDAAVSRVLATDAGLSGESIQVSLDRGVVTLTGAVDSLLAKKRAEALLQRVRGVRAVVNRLEVAPTTVPSDPALQERVRAALAFDPAIDASRMRVAVARGHVTLHGSAESAAEIQLARRAAESVAGVRGVASELLIRDVAARDDAAIEAEVRALLAADPWIDDGLIRVEVEDAVVILAGTVGRVAERNRAAAKAWVRGVRGVELGGLSVEPWAREPDLRDKPDVRLPPDEIARSVELALYYDPRVSSERVDVAVHGSSVLLTGTAEDLRAKRAAEHDAASTLGVKNVENRIQVEPPPYADEEIAERLRRAVERHPFLTDDPIEVSVREGTAHLTGKVDNQLERRTADELALQTVGATAVLNDLAVPEALRGEAAPLMDPLFDAPDAVSASQRVSTRQDIPGQGMRASNVFSIALAHCQQQTRCGFIGEGAKYESMDRCMDEVLAREQHALAAFACATETDGWRLEECLLAVRGLDCALPLSVSLERAECTPDRLCRSEP